jgi:sigma-B regulation protein RsbU (phosphoserine phosphatase)
VRVLSAAKDADEAIAGTLRQLVETSPWTLAALWRIDERTGLLRWAGDWSSDARTGEVRAALRRLSFAPGVGLPGAVFASLAPESIEDLATASPEERERFPRADAVLAAGLRSVLTVPVASADGPLGALEVLADAPRRSAVEEVEDVVMVARQLGEYLARASVEQRLRATEESSASIVRAALDCIVTMDHRGRVLDFNPAAEAVFGYERDAAIGERLGDLLIPPELRDAHHRALRRYVEDGQSTILNRRLELTGLRADGTRFPVELTVTRLGTREPPVFAGFIRDITDRRRADEELARLLEREREERLRAEQAERAAREAADALQRSLLPPHLPAIEGVEIGGAYRPGTEGWDVGGDFYDVFELGGGRWALAIGDVCGKGVEAAAMTAMVRYALRGVAVRHSGPAEVLRALNAALLRDTPPGSFCTAIYTSLDVSGRRPVVRLAVGGHPLPLLLRADGTVRQVGRPGTLLGSFETAVSHACELELAPGEVLLLYTDGVSEARTAGGLLGAAGLSELLAGCRGESAAAVARRVEAAAVEATRGAGHRRPGGPRGARPLEDPLDRLLHPLRAAVGPRHPRPLAVQHVALAAPHGRARRVERPAQRPVGEHVVGAARDRDVRVARLEQRALRAQRLAAQEVPHPELRRGVDVEPDRRAGRQPRVDRGQLGDRRRVLVERPPQLPVGAEERQPHERPERHARPPAQPRHRHRGDEHRERSGERQRLEVEVPAALARAEPQRRQHAEDQHGAERDRQGARLAAQLEDDRHREERPEDGERRRGRQRDELVLGPECEEVAAPVGERAAGVDDRQHGADGLLGYPVGGVGQQRGERRDPQQRARAAPQPPDRREPAPVRPQERSEREQRDRERQRVRERPHGQEQREQRHGPARRRAHRCPGEDEREGQREEAPELVEVRVQRRVQDDAVEPDERHPGGGAAEPGAERLAREQEEARGRAGHEQRGDDRERLPRLQAAQGRHRRERVVDRRLRAPDERYAVDRLLRRDRGRVVLLEEVRGAGREVRVRPVAEHGREAAAEHRHERDADQQQGDPDRPRDPRDVRRSAASPAPHRRHPERRSQPGDRREARLEGHAGVAQRGQLDPARARAGRQHPQRLVAPQRGGQPQPHEPEAGDREQGRRRDARTRRVVDRRHAGHPRGVGEAQRRQGAERDEEDGPQADGAWPPRARARRTRCTNTGFPRR